jgi:hypothetical protein
MNFDNITTLISLIIALVSLIVAINALKVSDTALNLSSREYAPQFIYDFRENGDIYVENPHPDLYQIDFAELIVLKKIGIEDYVNKGLIQFSYVESSKTTRLFGEDKFGVSIIINKNAVGPCALNLCPYNSTLIASLRVKLEHEYSLDSPMGYMLPSLKEEETYIIIYYSNKNKERKSVISCRYFIHGGGGYDLITIDQEDFEFNINEANIPKFEDIDSLWNYLKIEKFKKW